MDSVHGPLTGDDIRLLILRPGSFDDSIHCQLEKVSLSAGHAYEALSYVWGNASDTSPMSLEGVPYHITKNLECALRYLRHKGSPRVLWVDAVCIDQRNTQERNAQVIRMKYVYEQATQVVIWLGPYAPYIREQVESAFQFANKLVYLMAKSEIGADTKEAIIRDYSRTDSATFCDIRTLFGLISRSWFSRVWCIQEAAACRTPDNHLLDESPIFVCGWSSIPFYSLTLASMQIKNLIHRKISGPHSEGDNKGMVIYELRRLRNELLTGKVRFTPEEQLAWFLSAGASGFDTTDERDKIYALLGLLSCHSLPLALQPNYTFSAERVFWHYAVYILKGTKCLDVLTCSSNSKQGLPSWVPDWKTGFAVTKFHQGNISHLRFLEDNKKIEVDCMVIGHVHKVLHPVHIPVEFEDVAIEFDSEEPSQMTLASEMAFQKMVKDIAKVYKALSICEIKWFGCRALDANLEASRLQRWISGLTIGFNTLGEKQLIQGYTAEEVYRKLMNIRQFNGGAEIIEVIAALANYCAMISKDLQRSLYEDDQGNFGRPRNRGVLPAPGDVICYLRGSSFRFLLRLENSEYRLVGSTTGQFPLSEKKELKDMGLWEDYWAANKAKTRRIIIH